MLTVYEKNHIFLVVFVWFAWFLSKYKSFFLFSLRFVLLTLDLSSEAATKGVL